MTKARKNTAHRRLKRITVARESRDAATVLNKTAMAGFESIAIQIGALRDDIRTLFDVIKDLHQVRGQAVSLLLSDILFALTPRDPRHIAKVATHSFSQNYEDAVIAEIFQRIGEGDRTFVEIGVGDGVECNTRALLDRGWTGAWIEGDPKAIVEARKHAREFLEMGALRITEAIATRDNVNQLVREGIGVKSIDFLSLDIDRNTSHVWRALERPVRVACIEYNAAIPPSVDWEVPYDPAGVWDGSSDYGASLKALERIGREKNLALVGCDFHGVNAFFVTYDECADRFLAPFTAEQHFEPPRFAFIGHRGHPSPRKT